MTSRKTTIAPVALDAKQAAAYLNVSVSHFRDDVRKLLPVVDLRAPGARQPLFRWMKTDLDAFLSARRKEAA